MSITRIRRLERKLPAVDAATGFFVVGSKEQGLALQERYRRSGQDVPLCFVTGISQEKPLWIADAGQPGGDHALGALSEEELHAMLAAVRRQRMVMAIS